MTPDDHPRSPDRGWRRTAALGLVLGFSLTVTAAGATLWMQRTTPAAGPEGDVLAALDDEALAAPGAEAVPDRPAPRQVAPTRPAAVSPSPSSPPRPRSPSPPTRDRPPVGGPQRAAAPPAVAETQAPAPAVVRIPSLGVDAAVVELGTDADGVLEVPADPLDTGWWSGGHEPGEAGPAVVVGHVDSWEGPGVFHRLREIEPGAIVHVDRVDGSSVAFEVTRVEQHRKASFPTDEVYGDTGEPVLRLVTCGGPFDEGARSYLDNVIVFARLVG